jgi:hypothetical protein
MSREGRTLNHEFIARLPPESALLDTVTLHKGDQRT